MRALVFQGALIWLPLTCCCSVPCCCALHTVHHRKPGSFCGLQLLSGEQFERSVDTITQLLATALAADAPLRDELGWMDNFPDQVCVCVKGCGLAEEACSLQ